MMIKCEFCPDVFKYRNAEKAYHEHFERFHQEPVLNKDGTIQVNATHQICLILKGDDSWESQLRKEVKKKDESAIRAITQLMKFEKQHNIEFDYIENRMTFSTKEQSS